MTRSERGRAVVTEVPMDRILTETDGPFTHIDGHPAEPADVRVTAEAIAHVRNVPPDELARTIQANLQALLR